MSPRFRWLMKKARKGRAGAKSFAVYNWLTAEMIRAAFISRTIQENPNTFAGGTVYAMYIFVKYDGRRI